MQEVHWSSQEGVTSHCRAEWGCYWFLEVECPLENSASFPYAMFSSVFILACFCLFFCVFEVKYPQQNISFDPGITYTHNVMCHDLVYFCRQEVAFMYAFLLLKWNALCFT